jgi:starch phosphorylase
MVKRIHEYKRQLLFALYMIHRYLNLKRMPQHDRLKMQKRVFMVGGKAAPGYISAKKIIKLINAIGETVNNDPEIGSLMKVVFLPNYCVSSAQIIIPAADLSEQISTAGTEASGTGNMKFAMNGALIIGTMDGANVEIAEEIGESNMFIFGARVQEVDRIRERLNNGDYHIGNELREIFQAIRENRFGCAKEIVSLVEGLERHDYYLVCHDFYSYLKEQENVDRAYQDVDNWTRMSISSAISMEKFSSDRTIHEYAEEIWQLEQVVIPAPSDSAIGRVRSQPHLILANDRLEKFEKRKQRREATIIKNIDENELHNTLIEKTEEDQGIQFLDS